MLADHTNQEVEKSYDCELKVKNESETAENSSEMSKMNVNKVNRNWYRGKHA